MPEEPDEQPEPGRKRIKPLDRLAAFRARHSAEPRETQRDRGDQVFERMVGTGVIVLITVFVTIWADQLVVLLTAIPEIVVLFLATQRVKR